MAATPENKYPTEVDAIVILGKQLKPDGSPELELLQRTRKAVEIRQHYLRTTGKAPPLLASGQRSGSAPYIPPRTESAVIVEQAVSLAVPKSEVIEDAYSLCTWGNGLYTKLIAEVFGWRKLLVVSSDYHQSIGVVAFRHLMPEPDYEITGVASSDAPLTLVQANYVESATRNAEVIIASTLPGDDEAIRAKMCEVVPFYQRTPIEPASLDELRRTILLEQTGQFAQAA